MCSFYSTQLESVLNGVHIFPLFQLATYNMFEWHLAKYTQIPSFRQLDFSLVLRLKLVKEVKLVMASTKKNQKL